MHNKFPADIENRFFSKVEKSFTGCWIWKAGKDKDGYGKFSLNHLSYRAHRVAYSYFVLNYPEALLSAFLVCHTCDNPSCVNPEHLFLGTAQDNMTDKTKKGRNNILRGSDCSWTKLSSNTKIEIINLYRTGNFKQKELAQRFNVSPAAICRLLKGAE